ncbi:hypothetical protein [Propionicicella superfundia]|uniref:hypothetical protein n=1 Tax=Propionicicella superfundia TaxID=348582 RepID=UPI00042564AC|nr:hypothetical protein [Propionicicella superfundia]
MNRPAATWYDTGPLATDWPAPGPRRRPLPAVIGLILVLLVATVWACGGFRERTGRFPLVAAGTTVETGQLRVTFTHADARTYGSSGDEWVVTVYGRCENVSDTPLEPSNTDAFGGNVLGTEVYRYAELLRFGGPGSGATLDLNPGVQPTRCELSYRFPRSTGLTDRFVVAVLDLVWKDNTITGSGEYSWVQRSTGVRLAVPLVVLEPSGS